MHVRDASSHEALPWGCKAARGFVLMWALVPLFAAALGMMRLAVPARGWPTFMRSNPMFQQLLTGARQGLYVWSFRRMVTQDDELAPFGLLPYPDRSGDGNYDGSADCLSGTGPARPEWRVGKLPFRGEQHPCEGRGPARAELSATATPQLKRVLTALEVREPGGELLWFAAAAALVDDDVMRNYPAISVSGLLRRRDGWLAVCDIAGRVLRRDGAVIVIAPGRPVAGQNRRSRAPGRENYLEVPEGATAGACTALFPSTPAQDRYFVAAPGLPGSMLNDRLLVVSRLRFASAMAVTQGREVAEWLRRQPRFPFASRPATGAGGCEQGLRHGGVPLVSNAACTLSPEPPAWLSALSERTGNDNLGIEYSLSFDGKTASITFTDCRIRFVVSGKGVAHAPSLC